MGFDHLTWMQRWQRLESLAGPKFLLPLKEVYREVFQLLLSLSGAIHGCDSTGIGQGLVMALRHQQIPKLTFKGFPDPCMKSCDGLSHKKKEINTTLFLVEQPWNDSGGGCPDMFSFGFQLWTIGAGGQIACKGQLQVMTMFFKGLTRCQHFSLVSRDVSWVSGGWRRRQRSSLIDQ